MREARKNHGLVVVNSRIYAVGGQNTLGMFHLTHLKIENIHIKRHISWTVVMISQS